jgi:hypothetical protein
LSVTVIIGVTMEAFAKTLVSVTVTSVRALSDIIVSLIFLSKDVHVTITVVKVNSVIHRDEVGVLASHGVSQDSPYSSDSVELASGYGRARNRPVTLGEHDHISLLKAVRDECVVSITRSIISKLHSGLTIRVGSHSHIDGFSEVVVVSITILIQENQLHGGVSGEHIEFSAITQGDVVHEVPGAKLVNNKTVVSTIGRISFNELHEMRPS